MKTDDSLLPSEDLELIVDREDGMCKIGGFDYERKLQISTTSKKTENGNYVNLFKIDCMLSGDDFSRAKKAYLNEEIETYDVLFTSKKPEHRKLSKLVKKICLDNYGSAIYLSCVETGCGSLHDYNVTILNRNVNTLIRSTNQMINFFESLYVDDMRLQ